MYGTELFAAFERWWDYARSNYVPIQDGRVNGRMTMYYDPLVPAHHWGDHEAMIKLGPAQFILPFMPDDARVLFDSGIEQLGWRDTGPISLGESQFNVFDSAYAMFLAKEFGDRSLYAKVKGFAEDNNEPTWDEGTGEFWWAYGLDEPVPRGQLNAAAAMAEANSPGGWAGLFNANKLTKFVEPTVTGVDFPNVCLSQAQYDVQRRLLAIATDAGLPNAAGKPTSFRINNLPLGKFTVEVDGHASSDWRVVDDEIEVSTTIGAHTFLVRFER